VTERAFRLEQTRCANFRTHALGEFNTGKQAPLFKSAYIQMGRATA
jgi:hypothetical protein